jgi:hypothetical protein
LGETSSADASNALSVRGGASTAPAKAGGVDFGLVVYFALWYLGNYYVGYNKCIIHTVFGFIPNDDGWWLCFPFFLANPVFFWLSTTLLFFM